MHDNTFTFTDDATYWTGTTPYFNNLVDLEDADNFIFYGNKLIENRETNTAFLYVNNSGTDTKNISKNSFINTFSGTYVHGDQEYGIYFTGDNRDQIVTCNYFSKHNYCIYCDSTSQLSTFGSFYVGVGNVFVPNLPQPCPGGTCSGINYWVYNANSSDPFEYESNDPTFEIFIHCNDPEVLTRNATDVCSTISTCTEWFLGINSITTLGIEINVYPNPVGDQVIFDYSGMANTKGAIINIFDIQGRDMGIFRAGDGTPEIDINTSKYADGIYVYKIILDGDMQKTGKFEVKH